MRVTALATPGHTFTHLSYALTDAEDGSTLAVFSGGSLLYGATGRPDLLGPEHTRDLARLQHGSAHKLARLLPDGTGVYPTHGFGSFCSATQSDAVESTIGREREVELRALPGRADLGAGASRRTRRLPGVLRPHGLGQRRRTRRSRPQPALAGGRGRAAPPHRERRVGRRPPPPDPLRRRARPGDPELRARRVLRDLPGLARRLGHADHPPRGDRRRRRRRPARAGADRDRPSRRPRDRADPSGGPRATCAASRPPPSPTWPRSGTTARWSSSTCVARTSTPRPASPAPSTSPSRTSPPGSPTCRPVRCGCTAPVATAPRWPPRSSTRPVADLVAVDDDFDNVRAAGLRRSRTVDSWLTIANLYL